MSGLPRVSVSGNGPPATSRIELRAQHRDSQ